jgi:site-specific DNA-methyltransferase (adenine-specific)
MANTLYYGDNLDILRRYVADESVDLVYLDPPFNSNQNYNVLFQERDGKRAASQIQAFEDTWTWDQEDEQVFAGLVTAGGKAADVMQAFRTFLGPCDMLAYLVMMAPRLVELRRVMKPTASIYLHCDPTASHYLKLLMDAVFGPEHFLNEIAWKRTPFSGSSKARAMQFPRSHDVILFYSKGEGRTWNRPVKPYGTEYLGRFKWDDGDGRGPYRKTLLKTYSTDTFDRLKSDNRLISPKRAGAGWSYKQYLSESSGTVQIDDLWVDINALNPVAAERLGYPTQKPESLLERIIQASSNQGDMVLDPFCGCGTTVSTAEKLKRRWVGIDVTHLAITLMKQRLRDTYGETASFDVVGEPVSLPDAAALAESDPYQFQWWALGLVGARPAEGKKGADKGIDGRIVFQGDAPGKFEHVVLSVKAGNTTAAHVRDLRGVVERDKAALGVLITMQGPTKPMLTEAATAGVFESATWNRKHPRIQILTIADLLGGKAIDMPPRRQVDQTFKKAPKAQAKAEEHGELAL